MQQQQLISIYYGDAETNRYVNCTDKGIFEWLKGRDIIIPWNDVERTEALDDPFFGIVKTLRIDIGDKIVAILPSLVNFNGNMCFILHIPVTDLNDIALIKYRDQVTSRITSGKIDRSWWWNAFKEETKEETKEEKKTEESLLSLSSYTLKVNNDLMTAESLANEKLKVIHNNLVLKGGDFTAEYPEQVMNVMFIKPDACVLELGTNIGRNSLIIATLLRDQRNFVTMECDPRMVDIATRNRDRNSYNFHIEPSALSETQLAQYHYGAHHTIPIVDGRLSPNFTEINTITYENLKLKYNIPFDTLVADCEGALVFILGDTPQLLDHIHTVLMENDYFEIQQKLLVDNVLKSKNFKRVYHREGGWGPCYSFFFEVWQKPQ